MRIEAEPPAAAAAGSAAVVDDRFSDAQEVDGPANDAGALSSGTVPPLPVVRADSDDSDDDWDEEDEDVIGAMAWVDFREGARPALAVSECGG